MVTLGVRMREMEVRNICDEILGILLSFILGRGMRNFGGFPRMT